MSGHSKWKDIKRNPMAPILTPKKLRGFISSNEYEVGQVLDLRFGEFPEDPHIILSKKRYPQYGSSPQWCYEVERLPENPMTIEDMKDISS